MVLTFGGVSFQHYFHGGGECVHGYQPSLLKVQAVYQ